MSFIITNTEYLLSTGLYSVAVLVFALDSTCTSHRPWYCKDMDMSKKWDILSKQEWTECAAIVLYFVGCQVPGKREASKNYHSLHIGVQHSYIQSWFFLHFSMLMLLWHDILAKRQQINVIICKNDKFQNSNTPCFWQYPISSFRGVGPVTIDSIESLLLSHDVESSSSTAVLWKERWKQPQIISCVAVQRVPTTCIISCKSVPYLRRKEMTSLDTIQQQIFKNANCKLSVQLPRPKWSVQAV